MGITDGLLALLGKDICQDERGMESRLHFFGSIPRADDVAVNQDADTVPSSQKWWRWCRSMAASAVAPWPPP